MSIESTLKEHFDQELREAGLNEPRVPRLDVHRRRPLPSKRGQLILARAAIILVVLGVGALGIALVRDQTSNPPAASPGSKTLPQTAASTVDGDWTAVAWEGWLFQYPESWTLRHNVTCREGTLRIVVSKEKSDPCTQLSASPGSDAFVALVRWSDLKYQPRPTGVMTNDATELTEMFSSGGPGGNASVVYRGASRADGSTAQSIAASFTSPRTPVDDAPSYLEGGDSLAEGLDSMMDESSVVFIPREVPTGTSVGSLSVSEDQAEMELTIESQDGAGFLPTIWLCFGAEESSCGPVRKATFTRTFGSAQWDCSREGSALHAYCWRQFSTGEWAKFRVWHATFSEEQLDLILGTLTRDIDSAAWAKN
ncbi:MAG: hypothetical protein ABI239_05560 [Aquihabitans sp.]